MHLGVLRLNRVPLPFGALEFRVVYYQAIFATGAGYVYCLLFFLNGSRLWPTVLLHSVNNITASFYFSTSDDSLTGPGVHSNCIQGNVANKTPVSSFRMMTTHFLTCGIVDRQGIGQTMNSHVDADAMAIPWVTYGGLFVTLVVYWWVGKACSARICRSNH